ncbi:MAG TPA: TolC family protein [Candidatus Sulfopaludibacter sp.]|jgi:outer membrane protein TolC|nr:TolC family protein [Candidatus Sulfopaludibacter sp.]
MLCRILLFAALPLAAQELSLEQALSQASENNRTLAASRLEVKKSDLEIEVARTYRLPTLKFNLYEAQLLHPVNIDFPAGIWGVYPATGPIPAQNTSVTTPRHPITLVGADFSQPISFLHRIGVGIHLKETESNAARERLRAVEQSVASEVRKAYYRILQTESALAANENTIKTLRELSRVAAENAAQRVVLKSEELEMKARLAKSEYDSASLQLGLATQKEQLNDLMGRDARTEFSVRTLAAPSLDAADLAAARTQALAQRPEIREAKLKVTEAQQDRSLKKSEYTPEVSFDLSYMSTFRINGAPQNIAAAGFTVKWDILDWGRRKKELGIKSFTIDQARIAVQNIESQVLMEVEGHYRKLDESRQLLRVMQMAQETAREKVRVATERYSTASVLLKDLLEAQASMSDADYQYQQALSSYLTAHADFEKAMGNQ